MQQTSEEEDRGRSSEPVRRLNTSSSSVLVLVRAASVMMSSDECVARLGSLPSIVSCRFHSQTPLPTRVREDEHAGRSQTGREDALRRREKSGGFSPH